MNISTALCGYHNERNPYNEIINKPELVVAVVVLSDLAVVDLVQLLSAVELAMWAGLEKGAKHQYRCIFNRDDISHHGYRYPTIFISWLKLGQK